MVDSTRADLKERLGNLKSGMLTTISTARMNGGARTARVHPTRPPPTAAAAAAAGKAAAKVPKAEGLTAASVPIPAAVEAGTSAGAVAR